MKVVQLIFFSGFLMLSSCGTVDNQIPQNQPIVNKLILNGVEDEIVLTEMVTFDKLPANNNYKFQLLLHTGTTTAVYEPEWIYSGVGSYFNFTLWSEDENLGSGTYIINGLVENNFSITKATTALNVDWSTGESEFFSYLEGSVRIENLGNHTYEISISCIDYEGNPVTAYYKGEFYYLRG
jgi:hypothetical protein